MASSLAERAHNGWAVAQQAGARLSLFTLAPVLVVLVVFKLAISDGGRDLLSLTLAQSAVYATLALLVWSGRAHVGRIAQSMLAMLAVIAITSVTSVRPEASVRELLLWTMYLGIVVLTASTLGGLTGARRMVDTLVTIAGWLVLIALFMFWGANNPSMRWYATFYWPNPFAAFLLLVLPIEAVRMVRAHTPRDTVVHTALTVALTVAFVLTYSRGAWLSVLVVVPLFLVFLRPPSWAAAARRFLVVVALVASALTALTRIAASDAGGQGVAARAVSITDSADVSIQGRIEFWRAGVAIFLDHPLLGTGPGTFGAVHARYQRDARFYASDVHNLYLQTLAETGVGGGIALLAIAVTAAWVWIRTLRGAGAGGDDSYSLLVGAGIGVLAFFVHSAVEMNWRFYANPAMAFALLGIVEWADRPVGHERVEARQLVPAATLLVAIGVVLMMHSAHRAYVTGLEHARSGRWPDALRQYAAATTRNPLQARYHAAAAFAASQFPDRGHLALYYIRRAVALDRVNAAHRLQLAHTLLARTGHDPNVLRETAQVLRVALTLDPLNRPEAYRMLANVHLRAGDREAAERVYRQAVALYEPHRLAKGITHALLWPEVATLYQDWAGFLVAERRIGDAASVLRRIIEDDPFWSPAYVQLAAVHIRQGRLQDAEHILRQGLARTPDHEPLWVHWRTLRGNRTAVWER